MPRPRGAGGWQSIPGGGRGRARAEDDEESVSSRSTASPTPSLSPTPESLRVLAENPPNSQNTTVSSESESSETPDDMPVSDNEENNTTIVRDRTASPMRPATRSGGRLRSNNIHSMVQLHINFSNKIVRLELQTGYLYPSRLHKFYFRRSNTRHSSKYSPKIHKPSKECCCSTRNDETH